MRAIVLCVLSAMAGGFVMFVGTRGAATDAEATASGAGSAAGLPTLTSAVAEPDGSDASELALRSAIYTAIGEIDDLTRLRSQFEVAARAQPSEAGAIELEALLLRMLELDPRQTVRLARDRSVARPLLATLFAVWAERNLDAAFQALSRWDDADLLRRVLLRLVDGRDMSVGELTDLMAVSGSSGLVADALEAIAATDPERAADGARSLAGFWSSNTALERVLIVWARQDPTAALSYVDRIENQTADRRAGLFSSTVREWAVVDPQAALGYVLSPAGQASFYARNVRGLAVAREIGLRRPYAVLAAADRLPRGSARYDLRAGAMTRIVEIDLDTADRLARQAAAGPDRAQWAYAIVDVEAKRDPALALAWAKQFEPLLPGTLNKTVRRIEQRYPSRAEALGLCALGPMAPASCP